MCPAARGPDRAKSPRARGLALLALALIGCGAQPAPVSIVPDSATARRALQAAMTAWKDGRPTGRIEPTEPRIQVIDAHRKPGQVLQGFEILAETASPRERAFRLRLSLTGPQERPIVRYLLVGIDPILVFRQEDYDLMMHWEHKMDPEPSDATESEAAAVDPKS